jgi:hypothetical protein
MLILNTELRHKLCQVQFYHVSTPLYTQKFKFQQRRPNNHLWRKLLAYDSKLKCVFNFCFVSYLLAKCNLIVDIQHDKTVYADR